MNMEKHRTIYLKFKTYLCDIQDDFNKYIVDKSNEQLIDQIYNGFYITKINNIFPIKYKKINIDGSINIKVKCLCNVIDPIVNNTYDIYINDINKMGFSYKYKKICIFLPIHLCDKQISINDKLKVEIIGKRIEESILCIAKCI